MLLQAQPLEFLCVRLSELVDEQCGRYINGFVLRAVHELLKDKDWQGLTDLVAPQLLHIIRCGLPHSFARLNNTTLQCAGVGRLHHDKSKGVIRQSMSKYSGICQSWEGLLIFIISIPPQTRF